VRPRHRKSEEDNNFSVFKFFWRKDLVRSKSPIRGVIWLQFQKSEDFVKLVARKKKHTIGVINVASAVACLVVLFGKFPGQILLSTDVDKYQKIIGKGAVIEIDPKTREFKQNEYMEHVALAMQELYPE